MYKKNVILSLLFTVLFLFGCGRFFGHHEPESSSWGHGFGMGYGAGCYNDRGSMMGDLGLSNNQADRIADIDADYREKYYENRGDFDKINELRQQHRKEIDKVLNDSQNKKFGNAYRDKWSDWGRGRRSRHMGNYYGHGYGMGFCSGIYSSVEYMKEQLGLSEKQVQKIKDLDEKYRNLYAKHRGDYNKIEDLRRNHCKDIEEVLTDKQREKFDDAYDYRWRGRGHMRGRGHGMMGY